MSTSAPAPTKTEALGRDYADRLILTAITSLGGVARAGDIAEHLVGQGLDPAIIHTLMATSPGRFNYVDRKWSAAIGSAEPNTPVANAVVKLVEGFGAPLHVNQLSVDCASYFRRTPEYFEKLLRRLVPSDPSMFLTKTENVGLTKWIYIAYSDDEEANLFYNFLTREEIEEFAEVAAGIDWNAIDAPLRFLETAGKPVGSKVIGFHASKVLNPKDPYAPQLYDAAETFDVVYGSGQFVFASDGMWHPAADARKWLQAAARLASKLEPVVELEESAPLEVKPEEVDQMVARILGSEEGATAASAVLADMYDVHAGDRTYEEDLTTVTTALRERPETMWVGGERFRKPGTEPAYVHEVPELLRYEDFVFLDETGEVIDLELAPEAFSSSLRKELGHALVQDVLDDEPGPVHKHLSDEVRCVVKAHHKELGTFPMAQIPTGWLPQEPVLQEVILEDVKGRQIPVWVNQDIRLMFGLMQWYFEQEIESGSVFILHKTPDMSKLLYRWAEEPDPLCYISMQRMEELREIQERAEEMSTLEILMEIMSHYNKGADFITLVTELNVVRRVRRDLVASILTGYHCFYQRAGSPVWHYDAKKVVQGADKSKRKYAKK